MMIAEDLPSEGRERLLAEASGVGSVLSNLFGLFEEDARILFTGSELRPGSLESFTERELNPGG